VHAVLQLEEVAGAEADDLLHVANPADAGLGLDPAAVDLALVDRGEAVGEAVFLGLEAGAVGEIGGAGDVDEDGVLGGIVDLGDGAAEPGALGQAGEDLGRLAARGRAGIWLRLKRRTWWATES